MHGRRIFRWIDRLIPAEIGQVTRSVLFGNSTPIDLFKAVTYLTDVEQRESSWK